jgi:hypothetical protein
MSGMTAAYGAGALAISKSTGAYGLDNEAPNETTARKNAFDLCSQHAKDCEIVASSGKPGHGAFVASPEGKHYGVKWGVTFGKTSHQEADALAVHQCKAQFGSNCRAVKSWIDRTDPSASQQAIAAAGNLTVAAKGPKLPDDLLRRLNAQVASIQSHRLCIDGCRDFEVACAWTDEVGRADRANGVAERRFVALQWLRLGGASIPGGLIVSNDRKWREEMRLLQFTLTNGAWNAEAVSFGEERIMTQCNRRR